MKLKNILRNVTAMALPLALLGSCTGDFEELNTNPYEIDPEELPFEAQFSSLVVYQGRESIQPTE